MPKPFIFALTKIIEGRLYAIIYEEGAPDSFSQCFQAWNDVVYLERFFEENKSDLHQSIESAVFKVLEEAEQFEKDILACARGQFSAKTLDNYIFQPLHKNDDYDMPLLQAKSYGTGRGSSFIRLYAIRLAEGSYIVTGGAIKLTRSMQERTHTEAERKKLNAVANFLRKKNLFDTFDIGILILE